MTQVADKPTSSVRGTMQVTKEALDPSVHAARHPWVFVGGALVLGYAVGTVARRDWRLTTGVVPYYLPSAKGAAVIPTNGAPSSELRDSGVYPFHHHRAANHGRGEPGQADRRTVWAELERALHDELGVGRKGVIRFGRGLLREMVRQAVPALGQIVGGDRSLQCGGRDEIKEERKQEPHGVFTGIVNSPRTEGGYVSPNVLWQLFKRTYSKWNEDHAPGLGAALSYYSVFSLAPLLMIVIAIAGLVFGQEAAQGQIMGQIQGLVGEESAKAIQSMIEEARKPAAGILATVIATVMLLVGATGVFAQLQESLNIIWKVKEKPGEGIWKTLKDRFLSLLAVFGTGFLLLISLVISAGLSAVGATLDHVLPGPEFLLQIINFVVSFAVVTLLFAMIYKLLPDISIQWGDVWIGAIITSLLFTIGKFLIGLYLGKSDVGIAYGGAGSLVVILIWVYYASQIFLFGAEFTAVYAHSRGSRFALSSTVPMKPVVKLAAATN
jgi:membrane protein